MCKFRNVSIGTCIQGDVRLVAIAGYDRTEAYVGGEVQICQNGQFGSVCDDMWNNRDASVICRQLGHTPYGTLLINLKTFFFKQGQVLRPSFNYSIFYLPVWPDGIFCFIGAIGGRGGTLTDGTVLTGVNCFGNESMLLDCETLETVNCVSQEVATVICQGNGGRKIN